MTAHKQRDDLWQMDTLTGEERILYLIRLQISGSKARGLPPPRQTKISYSHKSQSTSTPSFVETLTTGLWEMGNTR